MKKHHRRIKLVQPGMQLRLVAGFLGLAAVGMCLQLVLLQHMVMGAAASVPGGGGELADIMPELMMRAWIYSFAGLSPVLLAFGVLFTFRVAGPLSRFEVYLTAIARGEDVEHCRIRADDELHGLCDLLNQAIDTVRAERRAAGTGWEERETAEAEPETERADGETDEGDQDQEEPSRLAG